MSSEASAGITAATSRDELATQLREATRQLKELQGWHDTTCRKLLESERLRDQYKRVNSAMFSACEELTEKAGDDKKSLDYARGEAAKSIMKAGETEWRRDVEQT